MTAVTLIATVPGDYAALRDARKWRGYGLPEGGVESDATLTMLEGWSAGLQAGPGWGTWLAESQDQVVASLAIKASPVNGVAEIGYAVAPAWRGQGVGTAAVKALLAELAQRGVTLVRAEAADDNPASGRLLVKAGFRIDARRLDPEDGDVSIWMRSIERADR